MSTVKKNILQSPPGNGKGVLVLREGALLMAVGTDPSHPPRKLRLIALPILVTECEGRNVDGSNQELLQQLIY